jgi:nucleotide sugar dehydrogenase
MVPLLGTVPLVPAEGIMIPAPTLAAPVIPAQRPAPQTSTRAPATSDQSFRFEVAVVGLGYVGLPTAVAFASGGLEVLGLDVSAERLQSVRAHDVDLIEEDLERLRQVNRGESLTLSADLSSLSQARTVIVCVPTPVDQHRTPDLEPLRRACASVVAYAVPGQLILLTSTSYVGTTRDLLVDPLVARGLMPGTDVDVAFSPERIDPGNTTHPQSSVPRVVGGASPASGLRAADVLALVAPAVHTVSSCEAAEMTKLLENTFRAVNIAFANEMADVCSSLGLDVTEVIAAASTKPYGFMPFRPGPGVGGHCIPCDPHYLLWQLRAQRVTPRLTEMAMSAIDARPTQVVQRCAQLLAERGRAVAGARVLVVGVAYKPDVADSRESPALELLDRLRAAGAVVSYLDPFIPSVITPAGLQLSSSLDLDQELDAVIVHTVHSAPSYEWLRDQPLVLDATYRLRDLPHAYTL